ncbi:hypothetical protein ACJMK2_020684 [Sinanodonta woodiana]|uniref:Secreted protein n=1 Tax=Sinanodonta woodiana TaxID=1069815 RepID=A0ABD3U198_SINWO
MQTKAILVLLSIVIYHECCSAPIDEGINHVCLTPAPVFNCPSDAPQVVAFTFDSVTRTCKKASGCYPERFILQENNLFPSELGCVLWCHNHFE